MDMFVYAGLRQQGTTEGQVMEPSDLMSARKAEQQAKSLGAVSAQLRAKGFTTRLINRYQLNLTGTARSYLNHCGPELDVYAGTHHVGTVVVEQSRPRGQVNDGREGIPRLALSEVGSPIAVADVLLSLLDGGWPR